MTEKNGNRQRGGSHRSRHSEVARSGGSGHRHSSGWRGFRRRIKRWLHRHKWAGIAVLMIIIALAGTAFWMRRDMKSRSRYQVSSGRKVDMRGGYQDIMYNDRAYRYNNRVTAMLYAGIDSETPMEVSGAYTGAPRADSISLVVMDELNERITIIALNRDTMTDIHKFTVDGKDRGTFTDHLCLAFAYGDGGEASCKNLCQAVSDLLFGIPISGYVVSNRASLPLLGDLIGPVEVVVPNDDLADLGFEKGETVTIDSSNLATFVRTRDTQADLSNVTRMQRQEAYIDAAMDKLLRLLTEDADTAWEFIQNAEECVLTDITRNRYLNLTKILKHTRYSADDYYSPEGEQVVGAKYDEFYPDTQALREKVVELFYIEK